MKKYIVRSNNKDWYVHISKTEGLSLTGCAEIAYKFSGIEDAEEKAKEINVTVVTDKGEISHAVLKDGKESFAYKTFKNGYGHTE